MFVQQTCDGRLLSLYVTAFFIHQHQNSRVHHVESHEIITHKTTEPVVYRPVVVNQRSTIKQKESMNLYNVHQLHKRIFHI